jgi:hypothetical protein
MATRKQPRSAVTGKIVTAAFAKTHPSTTVVQTVKVPSKKKGK